GSGAFWVAGQANLTGLNCRQAPNRGNLLYDTFDEMRPASTITGNGRITTAVKNYLPQDGFMRCQGQVRCQSRFTPKQLQQQFSKVPLLDAAVSPMTMCGLGGTPQGCNVAPGGARSQGLTVLADDW